jgi:hypothetical protein
VSVYLDVLAALLWLTVAYWVYVVVRPLGRVLADMRHEVAGPTVAYWVYVVVRPRAAVRAGARAENAAIRRAREILR